MKYSAEPKIVVKRIPMPILIAAAAACAVLLAWSLYGRSEAGGKVSGGLRPCAIENDTAMFLAGVDVPESSPLYRMTLDKRYVAYKKEIEHGWSALQKPNQKKIETWKLKHLNREFTPTVLYPFSGPDILNALLFFPRGEEYILFALEPPGAVPQLNGDDPEAVFKGLEDLKKILNTVIWVNFFRTNNMRVEIGTSEYTGAVNVMMWFISRSGYEVTGAKNIWLNSRGKIAIRMPDTDEQPIPGAEIIFRTSPGGGTKRIRYFQIDVSNQSLAANPHFIGFLEKQGRCTTILKSASYLMYLDNEFDMIRSFILSTSDYILQDDSGIPFRHFEPDKWNLTLHGTYDKPIDLFTHKFQPDFKDSMLKRSTGPLPFCYGYHYRKNESNLMLAERIKN